jgi:hypothetical protein
VRVDQSDDHGGVVIVTLDRPDARNAQTPATWAALAAIGDALEHSDVSLVIIRGEGSAFSAGLDRRMFTPEGIPGEASLASMTALPDQEFADAIAEFQRGFSWQRRIRALTRRRRGLPARTGVRHDPGIDERELRDARDVVRSRPGPWRDAASSPRRRLISSRGHLRNRAHHN